MFLTYFSSWDNTEVTCRVMIAQKKVTFKIQTSKKKVLMAYIISLHKINVFVFLIYATKLPFRVSDTSPR